MTRAADPSTLSDAAALGWLLATDSGGLGGARVGGAPSIERERWLRWFRALLPEPMPWSKVPVNTSLDRLLGGLDVAATLKTGRPLFARGILELANGGIVIIPMAERLPRSLSAIIASVMDRREVVIERDGFARRSATEFAVLACDEGIDDEALDPVLSDRLAFSFTPAAGVPAEEAPPDGVLSAARARLADVTLGEDMLTAIANVAVAIGAGSCRAEYLAARAARAAAALAGRPAAAECDVALAARLVLAPRATRLPAEPESPPEETVEETKTEGEGERSSSEAEALKELVLEAARAAVPAGLLAALAERGRGAASDAGRVGPTVRGSQSGRPTGARPVETLHGQRLHVLETLKAAAPWQRLRAAQDADRAPGLRLQKNDLRAVRFKQHAGSTTVFVVDASGSQAAQRLREVKGAIELLLSECYVRRDEVALVAFRGQDAELLLPPTRALARARRLLASLPGGGATPLAAGIDAARELVKGIRRKGRLASVVFLTDGRANVGRDGEVGHAAGAEDALQAARLFRELGVSAVLVDTSPRPRKSAKELADAMAARYEPLPYADANSIRSAVAQDRAA